MCNEGLYHANNVRTKTTRLYEHREGVGTVFVEVLEAYRNAWWIGKELLGADEE